MDMNAWGWGNVNRSFTCSRRLIFRMSRNHGRDCV